MKLKYYCRTDICLSLENFYNNGLTPERAKEIIESLPDLGSCCSRLWCNASGINKNWNVTTLATHEDTIQKIVDMIEYSLWKEIDKNSKKKIDIC